jgi:hypothetical protein
MVERGEGEIKESKDADVFFYQWEGAVTLVPPSGGITR